LTYPWSLPATTVIRSGERFQYNFGPMTRSEAVALGSTGIYVARFTFVTVACP
jgi:hypothetical protein